MEVHNSLNTLKHGGLAGWWDSCLGFLYPEVCQVCQARPAGPAAGYVCTDCWHEVTFLTPPYCERCGLPYPGEITSRFVCGNCADMKCHFEYARAATISKGLVLNVIHQFKYNRARWFGKFLLGLLLPEILK